MFFGLVFGLFAIEMAWLAYSIGTWGYLLLWPAVSFGLVSLGYFLHIPSVMGKRQDGKHRIPFRILHLPFRFVALISDGIRAITRRREDHYNLVAPGLWLGRRLSNAKQLPDEVSVVVDVTAEHARIRGLDTIDYHVIPTLDGQAPPKKAFIALLDQLTPHHRTIYIHCWAGRGRSATFLAALLIRRGLARDIDHAVEIMRVVRPQVGLSKPQRALLEEIFRVEVVA